MIIYLIMMSMLPKWDRLPSTKMAIVFIMLISFLVDGLMWAFIFGMRPPQ